MTITSVATLSGWTDQDNAPVARMTPAAPGCLTFVASWPIPFEKW